MQNLIEGRDGFSYKNFVSVQHKADGFWKQSWIWVWICDCYGF